MVDCTLKRRIECNLCDWSVEGETNSQLYRLLGEHHHYDHNALLFKIKDVWKGNKKVSSIPRIPMIKGRIQNGNTTKTDIL